VPVDPIEKGERVLAGVTGTAAQESRNVRIAIQRHERLDVVVPPLAQVEP
jgi:hypothetical protein